MEEKLNELAEQVKVLVEKVSSLESNSVTKKDLAEKINPLLNEIPAIRNEMISKNDLKIKVKTITGKEIELSQIQIKRERKSFRRGTIFVLR